MTSSLSRPAISITNRAHNSLAYTSTTQYSSVSLFPRVYKPLKTGVRSMRHAVIVLLAVSCFSVVARTQTADELVSKNIQAKGGIDKIKAIKSVRITEKFDGGGGFTAKASQENSRPNLVRETFALQGMTAVQAYDGSTGWQIQPFGGHKDPELMGENDLRDILLDADFDGPLV